MIQLHIATSGRIFPDSHEEQCSFCLLDREEVDGLVAGPGVSICFRCVWRCVAELQKRRLPGWRRWWDLRRPDLPSHDLATSPYRGDQTCSFCRRRAPGEALFAEHARICSPCVRLSLDVVIETGY